jgi:uncharacterized membrane protein
MATLGAVFWTTKSTRRFWTSLYKYVPALVLCYFLPALYNSFGLIDGAGSGLYTIATRYLLPATLVLLTLAIDLPATLRLGPKALIMFFTASLAVVVGGPVALLIWKAIAPASVDAELWRGMTAIAGSWIGWRGQPGRDERSVPDRRECLRRDGRSRRVVLLIYGWRCCCGWRASTSGWIACLNADSERDLGARRAHGHDATRRTNAIPALPDLMIMLALAFGATAVARSWHATGSQALRGCNGPSCLSLASEFFWIVILATTFGLCCRSRARASSRAPARRGLGMVLLYVLIATVGHADEHRRGVHQPRAVRHRLHVDRVPRRGAADRGAPDPGADFLPRRGQPGQHRRRRERTRGGAAFHPSLAPVGVLLAVLGMRSARTAAGSAASSCGW